MMPTRRPPHVALREQPWCSTCFRPKGDPDNPLHAYAATGFSRHVGVQRILCRDCAKQRFEIER